MLNLLKRRRSIRKFTNQKIDDDQKKKLIEAALLAPSSKGKRPVEFIIIDDVENIRKMACYKNHATTPLMTASLAIGVIVNTENCDVWIEDASIAAIFIQLEAEALGLGSTWIQMRLREGKDGSAEAQFRRDFAVPEQYAVLCVIAIGHKNENKPARNDEYLDWKKVHQDKF